MVNAQNRCFLQKVPYRDPILAPAFDEVFDIIHKAHNSLAHPRDFKKNQHELGFLYYNIPEQFVISSFCPLLFHVRSIKSRAPTWDDIFTKFGKQ